MQPRLWITPKDTISFVDKYSYLSTNKSTKKSALSTKLFPSTPMFIKKFLPKTEWLQRTTTTPNKNTGDSKYLSGEKGVAPKSTHSTSITSLYIYNIKLKGVVENR